MKKEGGIFWPSSPASTENPESIQPVPEIETVTESIKEPVRTSPWAASRDHKIIFYGASHIARATEPIDLCLTLDKDEEPIPVPENQYIDIDSKQVFGSLPEAIKARGYSDYEVEPDKYGQKEPATLYGIQDGWSYPLASSANENVWDLLSQLQN